MFQVGKLHHLKVLDLSSNNIVTIEGLKVNMETGEFILNILKLFFKTKLGPWTIIYIAMLDVGKINYLFLENNVFFSNKPL